MTFVVLSVAGALGAVARYLVAGVVQDRSESPIPFGTAAVNLLGAFLLGAIVGFSGSGWWWTAATGVMGGFTTFSTWMVESVGLGLVPRPGRRALANIVVLATLGIAVAALGYTVTG